MPDRFSEGEIKGVVVRKLKKFFDDRGWLTELFRKDELDEEFLPAMSYISSTNPGVTRGPHEHWDQADFFCFIGPSNFKLRVWDNRKDSETFGSMMTMIVVRWHWNWRRWNEHSGVFRSWRRCSTPGSLTGSPSGWIGVGSTATTSSNASSTALPAWV